MKPVDVSEPVMSKIVKLETARTRRWFIRFFGILLVLGLLGLGAIWVIARDLIEQQTFELLTLFSEDREIIAEFWQDTLSTFWQELPQLWLAVVLLVVAAIVAFIFVSRGKRRIMLKRVKELEKYHQKR